MALILIEVHIQFCTFVNFFQALLLLYIDSHPLGQFAAICLIIPNTTDEEQWVHSESEVTLKDVKVPPDITGVFAVSQNCLKLTVCLLPVKCALRGSTGMNCEVFERLINKKCNCTNALSCFFLNGSITI